MTVCGPYLCSALCTAFRADAAPPGMRTNTDVRMAWDSAARALRDPAWVPSHGQVMDPDTRQPGDAFLAIPDGSWCEISAHPDGSGDRQVWQGGPRKLWNQLEAAHHRWSRLGQPGWERFGLTVTEQSHAVWLDQPDDGHSWQGAAPAQAKCPLGTSRTVAAKVVVRRCASHCRRRSRRTVALVSPGDAAAIANPARTSEVMICVH